MVHLQAAALLARTEQEAYSEPARLRRASVTIAQLLIDRGTRIGREINEMAGLREAARSTAAGLDIGALPPVAVTIEHLRASYEIAASGAPTTIMRSLPPDA